MRAGVARPCPERTSVPKPDDSQATATLEPSRRRLILERLHGDFYGEAVPSERIATTVLAALRDLDKGPAFPS
jgi:hypothetical protein